MKWMRLYVPSLIPQKYVEQVKGRDYSVKEFFDFQMINNDNPCNLLFGYIDEDNHVKGYLWAQLNALDGTLFVNTLSVDKELWGNGDMIDRSIELLDKVQVKTEAKKVLWCSVNKRFFLKKGFKFSKISLMEYDPSKSKYDSHTKSESHESEEVKNGTE